MTEETVWIIRSVSLLGINLVELIMGNGLIKTQPKTTVW
jgi:hypothetical protein